MTVANVPIGRVSPFGHLRITVCKATPRSLSQPTTSFFAYLRQGIHTHALRSLTIKSILNTDVLSFCASAFTCSKCPSIFNCQRSNSNCKILVGLGRIELPTSPLSGVRSSQLSYRPVGLSAPSRSRLCQAGGAGRDRTGDLLNANQALSQLSYSPW